MPFKFITAPVIVAVALATAPAFAQQGTTLAGPAQGQKADGSSSMTPSAQSGANGSATTRGGDAMTEHADSPAAGTMSGGSTAAGGSASRN